MLTFLLSATLAAPPLVSARPIAASLFKNGYAFVTREIPVTKAGEVTLDEIPQSSYGTLWFQGVGGATLENVKTVRVPGPATEIPTPTFESVLAANVGRSVRLLYRSTEPQAPAIEGKVRRIDGQIVHFQDRTGRSRVFSTFGLTSILPLDGKPLARPTMTTDRPAIRIRTTGGAGRVLLVSLERGLSWAPGYAVDLTNEKELTLVAKATIINDLDDLRAVSPRLITGFPNLPYAQIIDPFVQGLYPGPIVGQMVGGFGGGGMGGAMFTQNAMAPAVAEMRADFSAMDPTGPKTAGEGREDLFFYKLPPLTLKRGERQWQSILRMTSPYEHVYTWDVAQAGANDPSGYGEPVEGPQDVWHAVAFKNTSGQPLTTAAAMTTQKGEILGQSDLGYVSPGGTAELRITKALDIRAEIAEVETARERGFEKYDNGNFRNDRLTVQGTLSLSNRKSIPVTVRITKPYVGEPLRSDGAVAAGEPGEGEPTIRRSSRGLRALNPGGTLVWTVELRPGEERKLGYAVRFLRPSN